MEDTLTDWMDHGWFLLSHCINYLSSLVVEVPGSELQLFVAEPEDNVPADQSETGGFKPSIEGTGTLQSGRLPGTVEDSSVPASPAVHKPDTIKRSRRRQMFFIL